MDIPTADASQCVELTAPKVPMISGRVVNLATDVAPWAGMLTTQLLSS
jgi:hypothetical protein